MATDGTYVIPEQRHNAQEVSRSYCIMLLISRPTFLVITIRTMSSMPGAAEQHLDSESQLQEEIDKDYVVPEETLMYVNVEDGTLEQFDPTNQPSTSALLRPVTRSSTPVSDPQK